MKTFVRLLVASVVACLPLGAALAGDFDGSKMLICATAEARDCSSGVQCENGLPADFALPTFLRVDVAKKTIVGPFRTTEAGIVEKKENQILLQGTELGFAWTFALSTEDGTMTGSIVNREGVYALFGACTPL